MPVFGNVSQSLLLMPRRAFLTTACLGVAASFSGCNRSDSVESKSTKNAIEALIEVMRTNQEYKVDRYLRAAIELQALGKSLAYKTLNSFLKEQGDSLNKVPGKMTFDINDVAPLCRMVFTKRQGADFRHPRYGGTRFTCATSDDWPLEPIEIVDGVPFHLTFARTISGYPLEQPLNYVSYCIENCDWNSFRFEMKSDAQKQEALSKFLNLPKIKGGITDWCKKIYSEQIR